MVFLFPKKMFQLLFQCNIAYIFYNLKQKSLNINELSIVLKEIEPK